MDTVGTLIVEAKTKGVRSVTSELDKLTKTSKTTTSAVEKLERESREGAKGLTKLTRESKGAVRGVERLGRESRSSAKEIDSLNGAMQRGLKFTVAATAAFISFQTALSLGAFALREAARLETLETSFVSLTGSVAAAERQVEQLTSFTASTPFQLEGVSKAARQLITARGSTQGLTRDLTILGDIAATANIPLDELASIYAKAFNKGKVQAEELNQISERGIPIIEQLAKQFGVTREEVFQLGSEGKIQFEDLENAFASFSNTGGFAFGAMQRQSETLNGRVSTLKDNVGIAAAAIGNNLAEAFEVDVILQNLTEVAARVAEVADSSKGSSPPVDLASIEEVYFAIQAKEAELEDLRASNSVKRVGRARMTAERLQQEAIEQKRIELESLTSRLSGFDEEEKRITLLRIKVRDAEVEAFALRQKRAAFEEQEQQKALGGISGMLTALKDLTAEEEKRLNMAEFILDVKAEELNVIDTKTRLENEAAAALNAAQTAATSIAQKFDDVETSLLSQVEIIEKQFSDRSAAVLAYKDNLSEIGNLTIEESARVEEALDRIGTARSKALAGLQGVPKFLQRPEESKESERRSSFSSGGRRSSGGSSSARASQPRTPRNSLADVAEFENSLDQQLNPFDLAPKLEEIERQQAQELEKLREFRQEKLVTEQEFSSLESKLVEDTERQKAEARKTHQQSQLQQASGFFGNLASISRAFGEKGFKAFKAASIAQALIKTYESATSAYSSLAAIPVVGPALGATAAAAAVAAGVQNVQQIRSQQYSGAFEHGGLIPAGTVGLVGETGLPEMVRGPAVVTSARSTQERGMGQGMAPVVIIQNYGAPADAEVSKNEDGNLEVRMRPILEKNNEKVKNELAGGVRSGGTPFSQSLEQTYRLSRV